jgi:hypothetical protein
MGVSGRSGRKPQRFCKRGHDKFAPHGGYVRARGLYIYTQCAVCVRLRNTGQLTANRDKERGCFRCGAIAGTKHSPECEAGCV